MHFVSKNQEDYDITIDRLIDTENDIGVNELKKWTLANHHRTIMYGMSCLTGVGSLEHIKDLQVQFGTKNVGSISADKHNFVYVCKIIELCIGGQLSFAKHSLTI